LFESISGRAFFYASNGLLLNYNSDGTIVDNPQPLVITLEVPNYQYKKQIVISPVSGRVVVNEI